MLSSLSIRRDIDAGVDVGIAIATYIVVLKERIVVIMVVGLDDGKEEG